MMHVFTILLVAVVLAAERGVLPSVDGDSFSAGETILFAWGALPIVLGAFLLMVRWGLAEMNRGRGHRWLGRIQQVGGLLPWVLLAHHAAAVLLFNWSGLIRTSLGVDIIALTTVVATLPPLIGITGLWAIQYPVVRRVRQATLIRRLDQGLPIRELPTLREYLVQQWRIHVLFLLVPVLLIISVGDVARYAFPNENASSTGGWLRDGLWIGGTAGVFLFAPLLARYLLDCTSLPQGAIRTDLMRICQEHGVRIRDILLWHTNGGMINGAVMGLIGRLRYVLLTDALLESMGRTHIHAVMAHEIGHVRRHHMVWLIIVLLACLGIPAILLEEAFWQLQLIDPAWLPEWIQRLQMIGIGTALACAFLTFGWACRRFERQADTFAVQHLSGMRTRSDDVPGAQVVTADASFAMQSALEVVARLNDVNPHSKSWRHGSIRWRQAYLASIISQPIHRLAIDRVVRRLKIASAAVVVIMVAHTILVSGRYDREEATMTEYLLVRHVEVCGSDAADASTAAKHTPSLHTPG